jgi:PKD repeat protein
MLASGKGVFILGENAGPESVARNTGIRSFIRDELTNELPGATNFQNWSTLVGYTTYLKTGATNESLAIDDTQIVLPGSTQDLSQPNTSILGTSIPTYAPGLFKKSECGTGYAITTAATTTLDGEPTTVAAAFPGDVSLNSAYTGNLVLWYDYQALSGGTTPASYPGIENFIGNVNQFISESLSPLTAVASAVPASGTVTLPVTFSVVTNYTGALWTWKVDGSPVGSSETLVYPFVTPGIYDVSVDVEDIYGRTVTSNTVQVTVIPSEDLSATIIATPETGVAPLSVSFTSSSSYPATSWTWKVDGTPVGSADSLSYEFTNPGTYEVTLEIEDMFGRTATSEASTITAASPNPLAIRASAAPSQGTSPLEVTFSSSSSNPGASWRWSLNSVTIGTSSEIEYTFTEKGLYRVSLEVLDIFGQTETTSVTVQVTTSPDGLGIAVDLAVEDTPGNFDYRYLKFYGSGEFSSVSNGVSVIIPSTVVNPDPTGFRRGRGPAILFD